MSCTVRIDPQTGLKSFYTRAASAHGKLTGAGYVAVADEALKTLPPPLPGAVFNAEEQAKYREFKESRQGAADYISMEGAFSKYLDDVYSAPPVEREPLTDTCEILVVGAGFAGLLLWHSLKAEGFRDVRFCEKGGDVGGTWYWNRYPGVACDVEAYSYLPLLDETGYIPTMKFASGFEILEYCQLVAERTGFYERCLFHTTVQETIWDETQQSWTVITDRGDRMRARYVVLANGLLTTPKLARVDGMVTFAGHSFHTSRWDYSVDLKGKRVGVIGTGASAVQVIPEIAKVVRQLYVFQRTPSTIDVRDQRATTEEEIATWSKQSGWARARRERLATISDGRLATLANDDFLAGKVDSARAKRAYERELTAEELIEKQLNSNFRIMEQIRARVDAIVKDRKTADALKPYYSYGCKRPTFHDGYLPTFNLPHVTLVDTAPNGVSKITPRGILHEGVAYELDVIIYATGFQWMATSTFNMVKGRDGETLQSKWKRGGVRTFLGVHSRGFPNLLITTGPQGGGGQFNFTRSIEAQVDYITWLLRTMRDRGFKVVDVKEDVENAYAQHCREADIKTAPFRDCLSYYNGDGRAEPGSLAYYGGPAKWHAIKTAAQESLDPYVFEALGSWAAADSSLRPAHPSISVIDL